jgi:hypothetical protein
MSTNRRWIGYIAYALVGCLGLVNEGCVQPSVTGSGVSASETRKAEPFSAIRLDGAADIDVAIADHTEVVITTDDNILNLVETTNEGNTLVIRERKSVNARNGVHVSIKTPSLDRVTVNGVGNVSITDLKEPALTLDLNGTGSLAAKGQVDKLNMTLNGTGRANLVNLAAQDATIQLNGTGNASVNSAASLNVSINGTGNVSYTGSPKLTQSVVGVGSVSKMD